MPSFAFGWPLVLAPLALLPLVVAGYVWLNRRRRRAAVAYSSVALIRAAAPSVSPRRRHVPFVALIAALACLTLAGARPQVRAEIPVAGASVILALDVSGSMCATDVDPNRLTAAQTAVRRFVTAQDDSTRIGLVVFAGFAQVAVSPTTERQELLQAIDSLTTGRGTTIGAAILKSVDAIAAINPDVAPVDAATAGAATSGGGPADQTPAPSASQDSGAGAGAGAPSAGAAPGSVPFAPEIVVLLTDGANTRGITPLDAARIAAARGVRVYPIGFGTTNPTTLVCTAEQLGGTRFDGPAGPPGGGSGALGGASRNFLVVDEPALRQVAATTGGTYFAASDAGQLKTVLADLPRHVQVQTRQVEVGVGLVALSLLLLLFGAWAAARWTAFPT